jgi:hypothetical protein
MCGDDGCSGSCGTCDTGKPCNAGGQCVCVANCSGRQCGDNGCGGSCGSCDSSHSCVQFQCVTPSPPTFTDVYMLFGTCAARCHRGTRPSEGMNLSTQASAYSMLVNMPASECTDRLRVAPGSPSTSYLVDKLASGNNLCSGQRMPRGGPYLTSSQIDVVRAWITGGAAP